MKKGIVALALALGLIGCGPSSEKIAEFKAAELRMQQQAATGATSWVAYARESNRMLAEMDPKFRRPDSQAALAYRVMIAAEVDAKRMSPEQYEYLWRQQIATMAAQESAEAQAASVALMQAGAAMSAASRPQLNCTSTNMWGTVQTTCF